MSHGDHVAELPDGFAVIARSQVPYAAVADEARRYYAVQFHPKLSTQKVAQNYW